MHKVEISKAELALWGLVKQPGLDSLQMTYFGPLALNIWQNSKRSNQSCSGRAETKSGARCTQPKDYLTETGERQ